MALLKSPTRDVMTQLLKSTKDLKNEKSPKGRLTIYETMNQLVVKNSLRCEAYDDCLHSVAIPIALQDISTTNDSLVLAALSFLGGLLQVVKLPLDKQALVVEVLTGNLSKVSEKNQSRKLMWSLANIQYDNQLQESHLSKMLNAACMFLQEKTPVISLSTVCESLNTLRNMGIRSREFFENNLTTVLTAVIPWLFNEADRIRELSLSCLEPFTANIAKHRLLDVTFQSQLRSKHYGVLTQLVTVESADSLKIWSFLIQAFGTELHDSVALLNELLKIEESALKSKNPAFRQRALEHWKYIIDCFALNSAVLNNPKRIKLVLVPLKSTDTRTIDFSKTKIELWWHLLNRLGPDAVCRFQEVGLPLLTFCFGSKDEKQPSKGTALVFSNILPLATTVLAGILSLETEFKASPVENVLLFRSYPFLSPEDFALAVNNFSHLCLLTLSMKTASDNMGVYEIIIRSFIDRCCSTKLTEPLKAFIQSLFETVTAKPGLMEIVFDVLSGALSFGLLMELLTENLACLLQWFVENEPLPAHPLVRFLTKFFESGITWNVTGFTSSVIQNIQSLSNAQESSSNISAVAELWSKIASALIAKNHYIHLPSAHRQLLLLPLTWSRIESDDSIFLPWSTLLSTWAKTDPSIMSAVLNPRGIEEVDVDASTVRSVLSSIRSELSSYFIELSSWIKRWTTSWLKLANVAENRSKCTDLLAVFLGVIIDELKEEGNADLLLVEVKSFFQALTLSKEVLDILHGIFGPASTASKTANVQKLRKHTSVCKMFLPLVPKNTPGRSKGRTRTLDEFVIVPPAEKSKRVLTDHQKEVMRSKRRASCVPAMYNDLSQSSQETNSISMSMDTQSSDVPIIAIKSCFSLAKEEDALLEPPLVLQQPEVLNELPIILDNGHSAGGTKTTEANPIDNILQKDLKLRSKVTVQMPKMEKPATRRSIRRSSTLTESPPVVSSASPSSSLTEESKFVFQRPGPASKKASFALKKQVFKKAKAAVEIDNVTAKEDETMPELPVDENHDKENGLNVSQPTRISTVPAVSPRIVSPEPAVDMVEDSPPTPPLVSVPDEIKTPEIPAEVSQEEEKGTPPQQVIDISDEETVSTSNINITDEETISTNNKSSSDVLVNDWEDHSDDNMSVDTDVVEKPGEIKLEASVHSTDSLKEDFSPTKTEPAAALMRDDSEGNVPDVAKPATSDAEKQPPVAEEVNVENVCPEQQKNSQEETLVLENNNQEVLSDSAQSGTLPQKPPFVPYNKSLMKSFALRTRKAVPHKNIGPAPSTGKRGAQILELSRKIQNEPPSKKLRKAESPPKEALIEPASSSVTIGELVITPNGSPARTTQWIPKIYSPCASPSTGILKKRANVEESEDIAEVTFSPASASKSRRVSFADPEVSHSVKISPIKKRLSRARTRRSLITTYDDSLNESNVNEECETRSSVENAIDLSKKSPVKEAISATQECPAVETVSEDNSSNLTVEKVQTPPQSAEEESGEITTNDENQPSLPMEAEEPAETMEFEESPIYPAAIDCIDSLALIVDRVTSPTSKGPILAVLEKLGVRTIGDFCALSERDIQGLDFQLPQYETIKQFLERHFARKIAVKSESKFSLDDSESPSVNKASELDTQLLESLKSDESIKLSDELIKSSSEEIKTEELTKSPDSLPNGQIIADSPEVPFSGPLSNDDKNSCSALASNITSEDSEESPDVVMGSHSEGHETTVSLPLSAPLTTQSALITRKDVSIEELQQNLSAEDIVSIIERHPLKDDIISIIARKYVSFSFSVNGKAFPVSNNF